MKAFWKTFLGVCLAEAICAARLLAQSDAPEVVKIQIDPETPSWNISPDFIGLGYETSAVAQPGYFSAKNQVLARLYSHLGAHGLIRIGGIISDHTRYVPDGAVVAATEKGTTIINKAALADLGDFSRMTGWKVMWGLNLGTGSKDEAAEEAVAVDAALGEQLQSFEIGNEVDALKRFARSYEAYHSAFSEYKTAVRAVLPQAAFSGPDVTGGGALPWIDSFAAAESADCKLLTIHYYRGGAGDPRSTIERLLGHDEGLDGYLERMQTVAKAQRVPYRVNETNSFYGGGKAGVSDTLASALWCLDYLFVLAAHGCEGVNIETDVNQLGFISHYSPIVHDANGLCRVRPEYYGLAAFAMVRKGDLLKVSAAKTEANLSVYITRDDAGGPLWITAINKDAAWDVVLEATLPAGYVKAGAYRLTGASLESKEHVTLAGAEVTADGEWSPGRPEDLPMADGVVKVAAPRGSAVLVRLER